MKSLPIVHGCSQTSCDLFNTGFCYVKAKFSNKNSLRNNFLEPQYYHEYWEKVSKNPEIYICSIMGDLLSWQITDSNLIDIFDNIEKNSQSIFFLQSKNPIRYFKFLKDFWSKEIPKNVYFGTSVENNNYGYRLNDLYRLKSFDKSIHLFVEIEPIMGDCSKLDFSFMEYITVSAIGFDQIYKSTIDNHILTKDELYKDEWSISLYNNPTINKKILRFYSNILELTQSYEILKHDNFDIYKILHKSNNKQINPLF